MRVLVVEDEPLMAQALVAGLRHAGFAVDVAPDGQEALFKTDTNSYDLLVLDRDLPRVHGDEVCRRLHAADYSARILMLTASSDVEARVDNAMLDRLETAFRSQQRFVANASHQLKTPLAIMRTQLDVVRRGGHALETSTVFNSLDHMVSRMEVLIETMLRLAKAEHARMSDHVEMSALVHEVVDGLGEGAGLVHLQLVPCHVRGDRDLLREALINLLENAIVHGDGDVGVKLTGESGDHFISVSVGNSRSIMPPDEVGELFEPFRQLGGQRTGDAPGYGLGLSVVRAIVEAHRGDVIAERATSGGLRVALRIPTG